MRFTICSIEGEGPNKFKKGEMKVSGFACDVANEENVQSVFDEVKKKYGKIDVSLSFPDDHDWSKANSIER